MSGPRIVEGRHVPGLGKAHRHTADLAPYFGCPVRGTFNVATDAALDGFRPCIADAEHGRRFWLVRLNGEHYAWAYRWDGSGQAGRTWELVSKAPLPDALRDGALALEVLEPWAPRQVREWAARQKYWFQSFPWSPQRADSALVWDALADRFGWSGATVLDIGCHYGYHSFRASKAGARVIGYDRDSRPLEAARTINDYIESQDVRFTARDPGGDFDAILYLSVHHQGDPAYARLADCLQALRERARGKVFVELAVPAPEGGMTAATVDALVSDAGGRVLHTYEHRVRFTRRIYELDGLAAATAAAVPDGPAEPDDPAEPGYETEDAPWL